MAYAEVRVKKENVAAKMEESIAEHIVWMTRDLRSQMAFVAGVVCVASVVRVDCFKMHGPH